MRTRHDSTTRGTPDETTRHRPGRGLSESSPDRRPCMKLSTTGGKERSLQALGFRLGLLSRCG